jgi:hypothetical protein
LPANLFVLLNLFLLWYFVKVVPVIIIPAFLQPAEHLALIVLSIAAFLAFALQAYRNFLLDLFSGSETMALLRPIYWMLRRIQIGKRGYYVYRIAKLETRRRKAPQSKAKININLARLRKKIEDYFPAKREQTRPTGLGNVLAVLKGNLLAKYGGLPESSWSKLLMKLPPEYKNRVDEADNYFMFSVVCSFLALVFSIELVIIDVFAYLNYGLKIFLAYVVPLTFAVLLCLLFYKTSLKLALLYGEVVENCLEFTEKT